MRYLTIAALAGLAAAECPNACSNNGECQAKDTCLCYDGFGGNDCSQRFCPSGLAFVDIPNGDLNHDGMLGTPSNVAASGGSGYSSVAWAKYPQPEYWNTLSVASGGAYAAKANEAHFYTECSGKGLCDRQTGQCACYDGYTGSACQRTTCPNDCSGKGVCRTVADIAAGALNKKFVDSVAGSNMYAGVVDAFNYRLYDGDKNQACVCDRGYGGVDCSLKECPRGDDPLTHRKSDCNGQTCQNEVQVFTLKTGSGDMSYKIVFTDFFGVEWTTDAFTVNHANSNAANAKIVEDALEALPNSVVGDVTVTAASSFGNKQYKVAFTTLSGNVPELKVVAQGTTLDAAIQAYEPAHSVHLTGVTGTLSIGFTVAPREYAGNYRSTQLTASASVTVSTNTALETSLKSVLKSVGALAYDLGSVLPVDVVVSGTLPAVDVQLIFKNNVNKPSAAKFWGDQIVKVTVGTTDFYTAYDHVDGNKEHSICSNRGMCDFSSGQCTCFAGYFGNACEQQNALSM